MKLLMSRLGLGECEEQEIITRIIRHKAREHSQPLERYRNGSDLERESDRDVFV